MQCCFAFCMSICFISFICVCCSSEKIIPSSDGNSLKAFILETLATTHSPEKSGTLRNVFFRVTVAHYDSRREDSTKSKETPAKSSAVPNLQSTVEDKLTNSPLRNISAISKKRQNSQKKKRKQSFSESKTTKKTSNKTESFEKLVTFTLTDIKNHKSKLKVEEKARESITRGEFVASIVAAAQSGILGTLMICLTAFLILCSKGIVNIGGSRFTAVHPEPEDSSSSSSYQNRSTEQQYNKQKVKTDNVNENPPKEKRKKKRKKQGKVGPDTLSLRREMTWKSRTCFMVDEISTTKVKKKRSLRKFFTKSTKVDKVKENKRKEPYLRS